MDDHTVNILLVSFPGLGLPRTLSLPFSAATQVSEVVDVIQSRLPPLRHPLSLSTTSNRSINASSHEPLTALLSTEHETILPLRLGALVLGGKGGFGSQLRAAGGRMSSRKNRNQQDQAQNGSNRNLDGRRLRTVDAAKKLADYLTQKPEMEKKEREERRKRWETVVEMANKREEDIKSGKTAPGQGRLDAEYVESKEMAEEKTREAVLQAMRNGGIVPERTGSESSMEAGHDESDEEAGDASSDSAEHQQTENSAGASRAFFGWDDEDDDDDDESEDESRHEGVNEPSLGKDPVPSYRGKGKAKAT